MALPVLGTTGADFEGTNHCLHLHECREVNPILPNRPNRTWQYALGASLDSLAIYFAGRMKRDGKGNRAFFEMVAISAIHTTFALRGFSVAPNPGNSTSIRHD